MSGWWLQDFLERFDQWVVRENPAEDFRLVVLAWVHGLQQGPHRGADRRFDLSTDHWFAVIPGSENEGTATTCLYRIDEDTRTVRCDVIATLSEPLIP